MPEGRPTEADDAMSGPSILDGRRGMLHRLLDRVRGSGRASAERRSDITLAALGVTLGLTAAIFPWYVFFNQDKFGVRAMRFMGQEGQTRMPGDLPFPTEIVARPVERGEIPLLELDTISTGNIPDEEQPLASLPLDQQPFPGEEQQRPRFEIVHIENGRAMIADEAGLWLVQVGSRLPDSSVVASIERRDGAWVVVTSDNAVIRPGG